MAQDKESTVAVTKQDIADIVSAAVAAAIAAAKAPNEVEQRKLDIEKRNIEQENENRKRIASKVIEGINNKRFTQKVCTHEHSDGNTHCVYVQERIGPGYLICQKNQCIIRPGTPSPNYKGTVIYDTVLFNKIFQKTPGAGDIFG